MLDSLKLTILNLIEGSLQKVCSYGEKMWLFANRRGTSGSRKIGSEEDISNIWNSYKKWLETQACREKAGPWKGKKCPSQVTRKLMCPIKTFESIHSFHKNESHVFYNLIFNMLFYGHFSVCI